MPAPRTAGLSPLRLLLLFLIVTSVPTAVQFYTDWLWFREVGFEQVFVRTLGARVTLGALAFVLVFSVLAGNFWIGLRGLRARELVVVTPEGPRVIGVDPGRIRPLVYAGAGVAALLAALFASSQWQAWLFYLHATPFGVADPILGKDASFYVFHLPFLELVQGLLLAAVVLAAVGALAGHVGSGNLTLGGPRGLAVAPSAKRHLSLLAAALLLVLAFGAWLRIPELLLTPSGIVPGASYVDVHAHMPALRLLVAAAGLGALLAATSRCPEASGRLIAAFALYAVVSLAGNAYAAIVQRFVVAPNEQVRETPYIVHNIAATRAAFALDGVVEREHSGEAGLTRAVLEANAATLENVPLWNDQPLLDTFGQIQEIRTYYDFVSVDNDRYSIDGEYRQIMLSARELNSESLPSRTWINERLTFTHGYGLTLGPVNQVTPEGLPVLFIKDLPPASSVDLEVTQPAIYFGELSSDHVFVKTRTRGVRLPAAATTTSSRDYEGEGGVPVGGFLAPPAVRLALPLHGHALLAEPDCREPRADVPAHRGARRADRALPDLRPRPLPRDLGRAAGLDPGRVHDHRSLPLLDARRQGLELHPQRGQGHDRRLPRHHHVPSAGPRATPSPPPSRRSSRPCSGRSKRCPRTCALACATRRASSRCRPRCSPPTT